MTPREIIAQACLDLDLSAVSPSKSAGYILSRLTAAGCRIVGPGELDDLAAAMWREEAVDSGTPASVVAGRTRASFDEQSDTLKARWHKFAAAALRALSQEAKP